MTLNRFVRSYAVRITIGLLLIAGVQIYVLWPTARIRLLERRIADQVRSLGGKAGFVYRGPEWLRPYRRYLPHYFRIESISLHSDHVPPPFFVELKSLPCLEVLDFHDLEISDIDLVHVAEIRTLEWISLAKTKITDDGLEHLKPLTKNRNFLQLDLTDTNVTAEGRKAIKRELGCVVLPIETPQVVEEPNGESTAEVLAN